MPETKSTVAVRVTGRVQGVSFRWWAREEAVSLGLMGWVCNERDGSVRALLHGPEEAVKRMIERLHRGPSGARVDAVLVEDTTTEETPAGFEILR